MTNVQTISTESLITVLNALPSEEADISIVSRTEPAMRKTEAGRGTPANPYLGKLFKVSKVSGSINWQYGHEVNRQREREGGFDIVDGQPVVATVEVFKAHNRKWGTRIDDSPFVEHNGQHYLEVNVSESNGHEYRDENNELVTGDTLEHAKTFFSKRSESSRQEVENKIVLRDYRIDRVEAITLHDSGMTFITGATTQAIAS
jgi:hypothetical protein